MSAQAMITTTYEEVYMDPVLEEELFGDYEAAVKQLFGSRAALEAIASSRTSRAVDLEDKALLDKHVQQCFGENAPVGTTRPSQLVKSSVQLSREEENRERALRREKAMKAPESAMDALKRGAILTPGSSGSTKRKRGRDEQSESPEAKKVLVNATLTPNPILNDPQKRKRGEQDEESECPEAKKVLVNANAPTLNAAEKRKRGRDDEGEGRVTKRGLTDDAAAEIGQRRDHSFLDDSDTDEEESDGVNGAAEQVAPVGTPDKAAKAGDTGEQHLAPIPSVTTLSKVASDLAVTDDDDEMTRMLKEELAKTLPDNDPQPEDPRIEEVFDKANLTEHERRVIALKFDEQVQGGKLPATLQMFQAAVDMAIVTRKQKAMQKKHAPKKPSPLDKEVRAEGQEIEGRPKVAPKAKKPAPGIAHSGGIAAATPSAILKPPMQSGNLTAPTPSRATAATPAPSAASTPSSTTSNTTYDNMIAQDLRELCSERGMPKTGAKAALLQRLKDYDEDVAAGRPPRGLKHVKKPEKRVPLWEKLKK